jgi:inosine-uridine nucleoside N-ribohydrolase
MNDKFSILNRRNLLKSGISAAAAATLGGTLSAKESNSSGSDESDFDVVTHQQCFDLLKTANKRIPVIFDTDIGSDIDDTWALLYLLNCPELDVKLIAGDSGKGKFRATLIAKLLDEMGRSDIPIAISHGGGDGLDNQQDWVRGYELDSYKGKVYTDAADAIIETIQQSEDPLTLICVGTVPNVQAALKKDPSIVKKARFVGMHGSIRKGYGGSDQPAAEANVKYGVKPLQTTFAQPWECSISPLDTCGIVELDGPRYQKVFKTHTLGIRALLENYYTWLRRVPWLESIPDPTKQSSTLFDVVAVYMAFSEELLGMETLPVRVTDDGMTVIDESANKIRCAMTWKDLDAFKDHFVDRITRK